MVPKVFEPLKFGCSDFISHVDSGQFYIICNSSAIISGLMEADHERFCAIKRSKVRTDSCRQRNSNSQRHNLRCVWGGGGGISTWPRDGLNKIKAFLPLYTQVRNEILSN